MYKIKQMIISLWKDESGQGTAEYVLILVGIVAVGMLFKTKIREIVEEKMSSLKGTINSFN